jgi:hypothetical protein
VERSFFHYNFYDNVSCRNTITLGTSIVSLKINARVNIKFLKLLWVKNCVGTNISRALKKKKAPLLMKKRTSQA